MKTLGAHDQPGLGTGNAKEQVLLSNNINNMIEADEENITAYYIDTFIPIYGMVVINLKKNFVLEDQLKLNFRQRNKTNIIEYLYDISKRYLQIC